ncbi:MAG: SPOR domain-containing protein [Edaphobacter sp.]
MNTRYSRGNDLDDDQEYEGRDREISLGTSFIVGIFFVLVLICAIVFAFGYSLGKRSVLPVASISESASLPDSTVAKPSSGTLAAQTPAPSSDQTEGGQNSNSTDLSDLSAEQASSAPSRAVAAAKGPSAVVLPTKTMAKPAPATRSAAPTAAAPGAAQFVVQVAAVSRQGDAAMLMTALKRKGYNAAIHQESQDKLLHIQVGSFATKKDAEAMRQRLISDGYNAIVK